MKSLCIFGLRDTQDANHMLKHVVFEMHLGIIFNHKDSKNLWAPKTKGFRWFQTEIKWKH